MLFECKAIICNQYPKQNTLYLAMKNDHLNAWDSK